MNPNTPTFRHIHTFTYTLILLQFYVCSVCSICFCIKNFPVLRNNIDYSSRHSNYKSRQFDFVVRFYLPPGRYIHLPDMCISCQNDIIKFRVRMCSRICSDAIQFSIHLILTRTEELLG